jgi:hypothetical protein
VTAKIEESDDDDANILANLTPLKKGAKTILTKVTPTKINPAKVTLIKGKGKGKERETNIELDYVIETIILIAVELGMYYEEAYYIGRYTLIIANNLLANLH